ncbi:uncharacterized protein [Triticum aestivum]|uniref:uncharacterized protein isoform X1 n=1 Tax=Triticum aestivum TaxID=4565 RepID=UPI001D03046F|nr:uncharacterized protein LOC123166836 isoform X1 [Triticum aestivum]
MQLCVVDGGRLHGNSSDESVKREDHGPRQEQTLSVDIDKECATQLQYELYEEYVEDEVSHALIRDISVRASQRIVYVIDSDSSEDLVNEIWTDPEHEELVETDRRLREQEEKYKEFAKKCHEEQEKDAIEQQRKDADLAKLCQQEEEWKTNDQVERDNGIAHMYQALYNQNDEQVREATTVSGGEAQVHAAGHGGATLIGQTTGVQTRLDEFYPFDLCLVTPSAMRGNRDSARRNDVRQTKNGGPRNEEKADERQT